MAADDIMAFMTRVKRKLVDDAMKEASINDKLDFRRKQLAEKGYFWLDIDSTLRPYGRQFYDISIPGASSLLIQFDPADSAPGMLEHAMFIVQQRHALHTARCAEAAAAADAKDATGAAEASRAAATATASTAAAAAARFVAIVVHLPPGTSRTPRRVSLDFSARCELASISIELADGSSRAPEVSL